MESDSKFLIKMAKIIEEGDMFSPRKIPVTSHNRAKKMRKIAAKLAKIEKRKKQSLKNVMDMDR